MPKKPCSKCGEVKPTGEFYVRNGKPIAACKVCTLAKNKVYQKENIQKVAAINQAWAEANRDKSNAMKKAWAQRNPGYIKGWRTENHAAIIVYNNAWNKAHPEVTTAKLAKHRASKIQATPKWADQTAITSIYSEASRLTKETGIKHHVDHIVPLRGKKVSGLHVEFNLRAIPATENLRKSNHYASE